MGGAIDPPPARNLLDMIPPSTATLLEARFSVVGFPPGNPVVIPPGECSSKGCVDVAGE